MVDSGCQVTTVSLKDSFSFKKAVPAPTDYASGVGGATRISSIFNCGLAFDLVQSVHLEKLYRLDILNPDLSVTTLEKIGEIMRLPSVFGMDILSRYLVSFDGVTVTLEK